MEYICNITFATSDALAPQALDYLRSRFLPAVDASPATAPRLTRVRQGAGEALSYALELRLPSFSLLKQWRDAILAPALESLSETWGENLMYFETILELLETE